ncbi:MAG: alpha/beta hydrolase [Chromatiaceae bacterium]|nr:alpha/beta hydrolase [Chromatiaceae bacterium]
MSITALRPPRHGMPAPLAAALILVLIVALTLAAVPATACEIHNDLVVLDDGAAIAYTRAGQGPAVLLLHGLFANKEQWQAFQCELAAAGRAAIAPDLPGYGQSQGFPLADYRLSAQAERLQEFAMRLGLTGFDLAGNSLGGALAAVHARRYPRAVRTLAFIGGPFGLIPWGPKVEAAIETGVNPFIPVTPAELDLELSLLFVAPLDLTEAEKAAIVAEYIANNKHYRQVWDIVNLDSRLLTRAAGGPWPTWIFWGQSDRIFPAEDGARRLRQRYPQAATHTPFAVGHLPHLEQAERTAAVYLAFLASHSAPALATTIDD